MKRNIICIVALILTLCMIVPANIITANAATDFYSSATLIPIKNHIEKEAKLGDYATAQGACTDSKYAYFAINNGYTTILKYDVNTWELVSRSDSIYLGHANDMTYNPHLDLIVVAHNAPDFNIISFLDPKDLTVVKTQEIEKKIHSISYNEKYNKYVVGLSGTYNFSILDNSFEEIEKIEGYKSGYLRQGADCDNDYLYFVQSGGGGNLIVIYNWNGELVDTISVNKSYEIESIFHVDNTFYATLHYYGNYIYRIGFSDKTAIKYDIKFDSNGGTGDMDNLTVTYGKSKKLPKCKFEKKNYFFAGWVMTRNGYKTTFGKKSPYSKSKWLNSDEIYEYTLFGDNTNVSKTTKVGNVTAKAFWIANEYIVNYDSNGGDNTLPSRTVKYDEVFKIDEHNMNKNGYIFTGWTAKRNYDGKIYGYQKDKDKPKWLYEKHITKPYIFKDEQEVSKLTYDGEVTFVAHWQLAFSFSKDGTELKKYVGIDKNVVFPKEYNKVSIIGENAFSGNKIMRSITIPSTINTINANAFSNCDELKTIRFDHSLPEKVENSAFDSKVVKQCYLLRDNNEFFIGLCTDSLSYDFIFNIYNSFFI